MFIGVCVSTSKDFGKLVVCDIRQTRRTLELNTNCISGQTAERVLLSTEEREGGRGEREQILANLFALRDMVVCLPPWRAKNRIEWA
jgi:hypothetical protein